MTWITLNHFLSGLLRTDYEKIILAATQHYHHPRVGLRTVGHLVICCSGNMFDVIISFTIFPLQDPSTYLLHPIIQRQQHCACTGDDTFVMKIRWYISLKCHIEIQYNKVNNCLVISQLSYNIGNWQWTEKWEDRINKWSFNLTDIIHSRIVVAALIDSRWRKASVKCKVNICCVCVEMCCIVCTLPGSGWGSTAPYGSNTVTTSSHQRLAAVLLHRLLPSTHHHRVMSHIHRVSEYN